MGLALAGALAEVVPPYAAIVLLALCGLVVAGAFRPRAVRP
jgi:hypothetical protein